MTRITNFARKRTYVEAGFDSKDATNQDGQLATLEAENSTSSATNSGASKKNPKQKSLGSVTTGVDSDGNNAVEASSRQEFELPTTSNAKSQAQKKRRHKSQVVSERVDKTEIRRQTRKEQRRARTCFICRQRGHSALECSQDAICFSCRQLGHSDVECPNIQDDSNEGNTERSTQKVVGICYRCGSERHTLARCKKPVDPEDPLPFASCFVCAEKGHLASSCPQNKEKGIYPNGGCCKLCGDNTHLAKNCKLGKDEPQIVVGMGQNDDGGADEDDFHTFKRRKAEVERDAKEEDGMKRQSAHSTTVKAVGKPNVISTKKVVTF